MRQPTSSLYMLCSGSGRCAWTLVIYTQHTNILLNDVCLCFELQLSVVCLIQQETTLF